MHIAGVKIDNLSMEEAVEAFAGFLNDGKQRHIVTVNSEFVVLAHKDERFRKILNNADLAVADGFGIVIASVLFGKKIKERVSGTDLMEKILYGGRGKVFLLGGKNGVAQKISEKFSNIVGYSEDPKEAVEKINRVGPNILFVALGAPKQEEWIAENFKKIPSVKVAMGVGGAFDFISGNVIRAPEFLRKVGLEWLWRFFLQPWRLKRIYRAIVEFPLLVLSKLNSK